MSDEEFARQPLEVERVKIEFVRHVFSNAQELIRLLDQKSNILLAVITLLSVALFTLCNAYFSDQPGNAKYLVAALVLWYLLHMGQAMWHTLLTTQARSHDLGNRCDAPEMIFPLKILSKHQESDADYLRALQQIEVRDIMADYSQQILEVSKIYRLKVSHANKASEQLLRSTLPWFLLIIAVNADRVMPDLGMVKVYVLLVIVLILAVLGWQVIRKA